MAKRVPPLSATTISKLKPNRYKTIELIDDCPVREVLDNPELWRLRGFARAAEFTWERTAHAHEDVYRELL